MGPDEVAVRIGVQALLAAYADAVNRRDWVAVQSLFTSDAEVHLDLVDRPGRHLVGPRAVAEFIAPAVDRFAFFEFVVLNAHVQPGAAAAGAGATTASGRVFMCELRVPAGTTGRDDAYGLYQDRYRSVDGRWRFAERRYRSMGRFPAGVVFPLGSSDPA